MKFTKTLIAVSLAASYGVSADVTPIETSPEWGTGKPAEFLKALGANLSPKQKNAYASMLILAQSPESREIIVRSMIANNVTDRDIEKFLLANEKFVEYGQQNGLVDSDGKATDKLKK
ncbi:hypothetical protein JCM19236_3421 [Vibrio sp. JCM 19236]|nr:hypothetical protein JCM19236_3421 [Vibrio sp. JCM 19236]